MQQVQGDVHKNHVSLRLNAQTAYNPSASAYV